MRLLKLGKDALKGAADATFGVTKVVVRNQDKIAQGTNAGLQAAGKAVKGAGDAIAKGAFAGAEQLSRQAEQSDGSLGKAAAGTASVLSSLVGLVGEGVRGLGGLTIRSAPVIGAATGGVATGGASMASDVLDSVAITRSDLDAMRVELAHYGQLAQRESDAALARIERARQHRSKAEMLDTLVVGGISLGAIVDGADTPAQIEEAFELAYPGLAAREDFADAVERMTADQLPGLVSGVKGKLFELQLADHLNEGGLPDGLTAYVAGTATQPGWDLQIVDENGMVVDVLQAKATESAQYVLDAMERYPSIDVTTTGEVYAQLLALGMAEGVTNSGITEAALEAQVLHAAEGDVFGVDDLVPSALGLAVIGMSVFMDKDMTWTQRGAAFGERGAQAGLAGGAAKVAMVVTQTWWIGLLAGVGSRWLASKGRNRREQHEALASALELLRNRYPALPYEGLSPA